MNLMEEENLTGVTGFAGFLQVLQFSVKKINEFILKSHLRCVMGLEFAFDFNK